MDTREQKLVKAKEMLSQAVSNLQSTQGWKDMLDSMAKRSMFSTRRLSFRNQMLLLMQVAKGEVATYKAWERIGRHVRKGEKSLFVLAPIISKNVELNLDSCVGFRVMPCFDLSQTEGIPLPKPITVCFDIEGDEPFANSVEKLTQCALSFGPSIISSISFTSNSTIKGWYSPQDKSITILNDAPRTMQFKTLIHEIAHAILHSKREVSREVEEVEAESTAYIVASVIGLDTSPYSVGYVASWSNKEDGAKLILESGTAIMKASNMILDKLIGPAIEFNGKEEY